MSLDNRHLPSRSGKDNPPISHPVTRSKPPLLASSGSANAAFSNTSSANDTSSDDSDSSCPGSSIDRLSPNFNVLRVSRVRRTVRGPLASLQTHTDQPGDVDSEARFTDWDGESLVYAPNGSFVGCMFPDGRSEVAPEDSISMKGVHRRPYEDVPYEGSDDDDDDEDICLDRSRAPKYEDRLTKLGYVSRLPDIEGKRHYRIELSIDKSLEEDKIRTRLGTISLSTSRLPMLNHDGLQPKLASDLEGFNNGFLEVKRSPVSGYGVFAVCDLEPFTPILIERELFSANSFDLYDKLDALTEEQRKAYHALHNHKRTPSEDSRAAIWRTNRFSISSRGSVFLISSRFNHACGDRNNVDYSYDRDKRCMVFVVKKNVESGSELFIQYGKGPAHLFATWGFRCACGGCAGLSEDDCKAIKSSAWGEDNDNLVMW
ncbi:hypothetical protein F5B22DRAFT_655153 [Xylaria bambusicola]|uniref:uncharacterized protein n=1 Tax=Xylaria bambusicola TaxID=326684 RepID=UPI002008CB32|nr:uncharacterized protein F5B22DRAFT_655153 [Xylaria bambusicola]KAI0517127.1 hypothetical protein F5B22DRAFT_655153 [Xylaria bambusicola]